EELGYPRPPVDVATHEELLVLLRQRIGDEHFDTAWDEGYATPLDEVVETAVRGWGPRGGRPSTGWESLTPTERRIVLLIAEGRSNPDVAAQLYMSRSTVKAHLSHIFSKLGVTNRTELAAVAAVRHDDAP
ncbi:response regulator transcription factor, partial [Actinoplanes sp. NPDC051633]|uniref:helix-turn-helix domain-containing protein n=1 Tax=Actinoplanes sp. NPDC051633 TaxID=3155670 RepID=UPI00343C6DB6